MRTLRHIEAEGRPATPDEQVVLARWSGWGAVPRVFDDQAPEFAAARAELQELLTGPEYAAARRSTLNAHYTDVVIASAMWDAARGLGFDGGLVLEPGCGAGTFLGLAPAGARLVGVEVEPVTAGVAAALYPHAEVRTESFGDTGIPDGAVDLVIGNVPFGDYRLRDPRHNTGGHSIHDHFLVKSVRLVRPGGLVIALTSRYTLDRADPAARRELAGYADLVGALRLPTGAHRRSAGTSAVTDLLVLRRREPGAATAPPNWIDASPLRVREGPDPHDDDAVDVRVNDYFHDHPDQILGVPGLGGAHRWDDLAIVGELGDGTALREGLDRIVAAASRTGPGHTDRPAPTTDDPTPITGTARPVSAPRAEGTLSVSPDGGFTRVRDGALVAHAVPSTQVAELTALLGLRDTVLALLDAQETTTEDTPRIEALRAELGRRYDDYSDTYGPIRRFGWRRTGHLDPDTGEERMAKRYPPQGGFRSDPYAPVVRALEEYDEATGTATRAAIFTRRVVAPRSPRRSAETAADAVAICLDVHGEIRLPEIAALLGVDPDTVREQLGELVFDEPPAAAPDTAGPGGPVEGPARLVVAAEYLSGDVRAKLAVAEQAARADPRFAVNTAALAAVVPRDLGPAEIRARLGVPWIDADVVEQFLRETLDDAGLRVEHPGGTLWSVRGAGVGVAATSTWGTPRRAAPDLAEAALEQRVVRIYDEQDDGRRVFNATDTLAAQEKQAALQTRFGEWVWEDPDRARTLARVYNERFNSIALRSYDGAELSLPGLSTVFAPHPHQLAAVARIVAEPAVGLFHEVGAGKTAEMVMGAMELRRLGFVRKPAIVVPNHMLDQVASEFLTLYPRAHVLPAGSEDLVRQRRREFVARAATGDWDAIVLTRSAFEKLPMSRAHQVAYEQRETERLRRWLDRLKSGGQRSLTVKRMEGILARAEERLKDHLDTIKDPGLTFEQTGIDWLAIDEAHDYKNLRTLSNIPDAAVEGAKRSTDLHMKLTYLRERHGGRVGVLATATPIANSITEAHVMQRYLRPDLLDAAGVEDFDSWAATFGEVVTGIELAPDGGTPRMKARFARFSNVPELLRTWHVPADVKTADDLRLPVPELAPGPDGARGPETVVVPGSAALSDVVADLVRRAEAIRSGGGQHGRENMLTITGQGRAAALDLRLVGADTDETTKLDVAADRITDIWARHRDRRYQRPDDDGPHPTPGALQLVFCDLGTPSTKGFDVYHVLREALHRRGLPGGSVRFVHEARNDAEKAALFLAARTGQIAVLIGSTQRMGVGTNVQTRAVALHHLDCPWRPADIAQREGRILRQRNQNPEVRILRYVTEGSFDAYSWQTVTRKARFIAQVMRGRLDIREIDDIGDAALSYDEVKALATGDPRILDKAKADADVVRLERLERAHHRNHDHLTRTADEAERIARDLHHELDATRAAITRRIDTRGDAFRARIDGHDHPTRNGAGTALLALLDRHRNVDQKHEILVGEIGGHTLTATVRRTLDDSAADVVAELRLRRVPRSTVRIELDRLTDHDPVGLVQQIENKLRALDELADTLPARIRRAETEAGRARAELDRPFTHRNQLTDARRAADTLARELTTRLDDAQHPDDTTTTAEADPTRVAERALGTGGDGGRATVTSTCNSARRTDGSRDGMPSQEASRPRCQAHDRNMIP